MPASDNPGYPSGFGNIVAAFDHVRQYLQGYRLDFSNGISFGDAICHNARKRRNRSQDPPVILSLDFNADRLNLYHDGLNSNGNRPLPRILARWHPHPTDDANGDLQFASGSVYKDTR